MKKRRITSRIRAAQVSRTSRSKASRIRSPRAPARKPFVIDFHAHIVMPEVLEVTYRKSLFAQAIGGEGAPGKVDAMPEAWMRAMTDVTTRFKDMDTMGVDMQVISPSILQQCTYWAEPQESLRLERICNECVAETVSQHPDRLVGLGSVPMQDTALA